MEMNLGSMYYKKIDRDIKGVIKVGQADEENVKQELEEYVVTDELKDRIDQFFEAYKSGIVGNTDKNGVWISGFFGSGKSHLLKILSYLLENKEIEGKNAISYFNDKGLDNFTFANMKAAEDVSSDVILFNIDSKAESDSKNDKDAIVNVFNKVFNEMQGYCGSMPWLADLERQMDKDGTYEDYKAEFEKISGKTWIDAREDYYYEEDAIIEALAKTTKMSEETARNWYNTYLDNYSLSIDKFSSRIKEYCESKGKNHHVIFLVDEIGQYIGDNTQLMLNLQTVVEDLGTKCGGKCWVIVTSQEQIDEFTKVKGNDFSKIQGRFSTRLSLSSANVDEVIKKRLLKKKDFAESHLKALYDQNESVIKNLLTFSDSAEMKIYEDSEDFAEVYPFIPYQFHLLQATFNGVREHGASGKSLSKGERSLLGAFQQVAIDYMDKDTSVLVPYSAFYGTIESFLDSSIRSVIMNAGRNNNLNKFDVEVLKLLFLIKYVKEVEGNIENIATLLVDSINASKKEIKDKVNESLKRLIKETLVQKNGDEYIFLTNDEQDVNKEIKNIVIDTESITQKAGEIIFDDIYKDSKYNYEKKYMFTFNKTVDDRTRGPQNNEIGIRIITANYDLVGGTSQNELKALSIRENNVIVNIARDTNFLEEIEEVLKIDAYLRLKSGSKLSSSIEDIKNKKTRERDERSKRVSFLIEEALRIAEVYVNGSLLDIKEKDGVSRINEGLKALIESKYNKLNYIKDFKDSVNDLYAVMDSKMNQMSLVDNDKNRLAVEEVKNHIETNTIRNLQVTAKSIITKFSNAPYGWKEIDIQNIIVTLFKKQDIKAILNNDTVAANNREIVTYVTKRDYVDRVILKIREKVAPKYIDVLKEMCKELFGYSSVPADEDGMMANFKSSCNTEITNINTMLQNYNSKDRYPGQNVLLTGKKLFEKIVAEKDTLQFFKNVYEMEDELLDYSDDIDEVKSFFYKKSNNEINMNSKGEQRVIFDNAIEKLKNYEENKEFIVDADVEKVVNDIKTIMSKEKPYKEIPNLPLLTEKYNEMILKLLEDESKPEIENIEKCKNEVLESAEEYGMREKFAERIHDEFAKLKKRIDEANNFASISSMSGIADKAKVRLIQSIMNEHNAEVAKKQAEEKKRNTIASVAEGGDTYTETPPQKTIEKPVEVTTKVLSMKDLVKGSKTIKNKDDIDKVVEELRKKLQDELEENTIISLV